MHSYGIKAYILTGYRPLVPTLKKNVTVILHEMICTQKYK